MRTVFWLSWAASLYAYAGYPLLLWWFARRPATRPPAATAAWPEVTMIVPVHNERHGLEGKLANVRGLDYPAGRLHVLFVSDGSTDGTVEYLEASGLPGLSVIALPVRSGKAAALNAGLAATHTPLVIFSDAGIALDADAIRAIVRPFDDPAVGCVSGEDRISGGGGEGLYGRYEMFLRRQESALHSIVGASGSFYAQRRALCAPFEPNLAPDFLSVLRTVDQGYRALNEPAAVGYMHAVSDPRQEFQRKVRTILRGLTTLGAYRHMLAPWRTGVFALELLSHKLMRWLVPLFMLAMLVSSAVLAAESRFFAVVLGLQIVFYGLAWWGRDGASVPGLGLPTKVATYFTAANVATLVAWIKYVSGERQELWAPSKR